MVPLTLSKQEWRASGRSVAKNDDADNSRRLAALGAPPGPVCAGRGTVYGHPMRAIWKDTTVAESDDTVVVEGNHYFPATAVKSDLLRPSDTHSTCPWKGIASYYDVVVDGEVNKDAAWYYPEPSQAAARIKGRIAFWRGVKVST